ncbi:3D domain-containing protein [Microbulbifer donghaiensis]|nr:3D domain-containing protein [Microbulbifer donghaiensis]
MTVHATAYNSVPGQTDDDPWVAAWNNRLRPGDKVIAVSRDLEKHGLTNGAKVQIEGLPGTYTVRDRMNKRFKNRIDVWMEKDIKKARKWGKKTLKIKFKPVK